MKQFKPYVIIILLLTILVVPVFVYASWWNPFSWHWDNIFKIFSKTQNSVVQLNQNINQNQKAQSPMDQTTDWQTYKSDKYGFEIKYPKDWYLNEFPDKSHVGFRTYSDKAVPKPQDSLITIDFEKSSSIANWINQFKTGLETEMKSAGMIFFQNEITVGSEKGYKTGFTDPKTNSKVFTNIVLFRNGIVFIINQSSPISCQNLECNILNQMLSTFKLTEIKISNENKEIKPTVKPTKIESFPTEELSKNDISRMNNEIIISVALVYYFNDHNELPQTLDRLLDVIPRKGYSYVKSESLLKDPETKEFYEYHPAVHNYQLCINYDKTGRQCYGENAYLWPLKK